MPMAGGIDSKSPLILWGKVLGFSLSTVSQMSVADELCGPSEVFLHTTGEEARANKTG